MSGQEPTKTRAAGRKWTTRVAVRGNAIEVTPGDGVNPKTLGAWVAENVALPDGDGLVLVRVTSWYPRWVAEAVAAHPAPEVPCRTAEAHEIPATARRARLAAETAGWTVVATYARGTTLAGKVVNSLALRMRLELRRAVAVWEDGRFAFGARWGAGVPLQKLGIKALLAWQVAP